MEEINLYDLLKYYLRKWPVIVGLTLLGLAAGLVFNNFIQTPLYRSEATLILIDPENRQASQDVTLINNYVELFQSRRVLSPVIDGMNLDMTYDQAEKAVTASAEKDTDVIKVSFASQNPATSQEFVERSLESFKSEAKELFDIDNVQVVDEASFDDDSYNVRENLQLILASLAGFLVAVIGLFFVYDFKLSQPAGQTVSTNSGADDKAARDADKRKRRALVSRAFGWMFAGSGAVVVSEEQKKKSKQDPLDDRGDSDDLDDRYDQYEQDDESDDQIDDSSDNSDEPSDEPELGSSSDDDESDEREAYGQPKFGGDSEADAYGDSSYAEPAINIDDDGNLSTLDEEPVELPMPPELADDDVEPATDKPRYEWQNYDDDKSKKSSDAALDYESTDESDPYEGEEKK